MVDDLVSVHRIVVFRRSNRSASDGGCCNIPRKGMLVAHAVTACISLASLPRGLPCLCLAFVLPLPCLCLAFALP